MAYASRTLIDAERRYSATEQEGLTVAWAVHQFESYVMGMTFVVVTDHSAFKGMRTKTELAGRLQRFAKKLSSYDYNIVYQSGKENFAPDLLSRALLFVSPDVELLMAKEIEHAESLNWLWVPRTSRVQVLRDLHYW